MIYNVQALRALAACLVVVVHLAGLLERLGVHGAILDAGAAGVDLFFVISGFVMLHTTTGRRTAPGAFLLNRVIRVVPLYWLLTLALFTVALAVPALLGATRATLADLVRSLTFVPFVKPNGLCQPLLFLGWTLNYEMMFYLLFAATLAIRGDLIRMLCASALLGLIVVAGAVLRPTNAALAFWSDPIVLEFGYGMALALLWTRRRLLPPAGAWCVLAAGLLILIGHGLLLPYVPRWIVCGGAGAAVLLGALSLEEAGAVLRARSVQLLGAASYALYLTHPFVTQAVIKLAGGGGIVGAVVGIGAALLLAIGVGLGVHLAIERPLGRWFRTAAGHRASTVERNEPRIA